MIHNTFLKGILIFVGLILLTFLGILFFVWMAFGGIPDDFHTKEELISNYIERKEQLLAVKAYFKSIVPGNKQVEIEFESNSRLFRFGVADIDTTTGERMYPGFLEWNVKTSSDKVDSVLASLGWTQETLQMLKQKLDQANCIQIESGEPTKIGWQRSGMGMYSYNIFDKPVADSLRKRYNDSCTYILYNDRVVLEYGGGAIGSQCFP